MNLNDQIKKRMDLFGLHIPYSIRMLPESDDFADIPDEKVELRDGQLTFHLTPENSVITLNELVAKASVGHKYGELLCSQSFNQKASKEHILTFYNITSPLVNAFAFKEMQLHLSDKAMNKEVMEWKMFLDALIAIEDQDKEIKSTIMGMYVALVNSKIIDSEVPNCIKAYREPIEIMLAMLKEEPSPELLCRTADRLVGKSMQTVLVKTKQDKIVFCFIDTKEELSA